MYRLERTNQADALTRQDQELDNQIAVKIAFRTQMLLGLKRLNLQIIAELDQEAVLCFIEMLGLDFIDELLQANRTALSLQDYCKKAEDGKYN